MEWSLHNSLDYYLDFYVLCCIIDVVHKERKNRKADKHGAVGPVCVKSF